MQIIIIISYLILWLLLILFIWSLEIRSLLSTWLADYTLPLNCALLGGLGGITYCFRAIYLNKCVHKRWDSNWLVWYMIRPLVSLIIGGMSFIILKAGLLVLDAGENQNQLPYGYLALAFVAGLNVDSFLVRIEKAAKIMWGIEPSRITKESTKNENNNS